jgi:hypothetical protein
MYIWDMRITNYPTYDKNPFRIESRFIRPFKTTNITADGEVKVKLKHGDFQEHIRIFPEAYSLLRGMNSMAIELLCYIFKDISNDIVRLSIPELMKEFNIASRSTVYRGISDLLDKQFIVRRAGSDVYFINPSLIFKGSRVDWYNKIIEDETNS